MDAKKTNYEEYREKLLEIPGNKVKYQSEREKIKLEMMFETLREQVRQDRGQRIILGQITRIYKEFARIAL